jgi:tetratricopeptide (TPR) repeat protein
MSPATRHDRCFRRPRHAAGLTATALLALASAFAAAEPAPPAAAVAPADRASWVAERDVAQQQFLRLMDEKRFGEAEAAARNVVMLSARISGETDIALAAPLKNLATAQLEHGELAEAAANYQACIDIIERREGILSVRLVDALLGLGKTLTKAGRYEDARLAYARALQINHASKGFYNPDQLPIRDGLSEAYLGLEKLDESNFQQEAQVSIQRHRTGEQSAEMASVHLKLARWYQRVGLYELANLSYQRASDSIARTAGEKDPAMVDVLIGRSDSYRSQGLVGIGLGYLKRALELSDSLPDPDRARHGSLLIEIGDTHLLLGQTRAAVDRYTEAWSYLSQDPVLIAQRDELLARPVLVFGPVPSPLTRTARGISPRERAGALADGAVVTTLNVDAEGRPRSIAVEESSPPKLMDIEVVETLRASLFRPRMVDGKVVATEHLRYQHKFQYARSEVSRKGTSEGTSKSGERIDLPPNPAGLGEAKSTP